MYPPTTPSKQDLIRSSFCSSDNAQKLVAATILSLAARSLSDFIFPGFIVPQANCRQDAPGVTWKSFPSFCRLREQMGAHITNIPHIRATHLAYGPMSRRSHVTAHGIPVEGRINQAEDDHFGNVAQSSLFLPRLHRYPHSYRSHPLCLSLDPIQTLPSSTPHLYQQPTPKRLSLRSRSLIPRWRTWSLSAFTPGSHTHS